MAVFLIPATATVSTLTKVEADSLEEAIQLQYDDGWPGLMFLDHRYPDEGDWEIDETYAEELNA